MSNGSSPHTAQARIRGDSTTEQQDGELVILS